MGLCAILKRMPPEERSTATAVMPHAAPYLADSLVFDWRKSSFRSDWIFSVATAICLGAGLAAGHPGAALIAGSGAMTVGLGAKQSIDDSRLLPMIFVSLGMSLSTFFGMIASHESFVLVILAALWGFGYGMLSKRQAGYSWVGQQCVVTLLVASAFPFSVKAAAVRSLLELAGGAVQIICSSLLLRIFGQLKSDLVALGGYIRSEETEMRAMLAEAFRSLGRGEMQDAALPYSLRLAATLGICTEIYQRVHFSSGYWIPMTALLVLKPGLVDTVSRALARTLGTITGAVLVSLFIRQLQPGTVEIAFFIVLFAWLSYGMINVNYGLFTLFLTAYVVFLLSLANMPANLTAERRAFCTFLGGAIALSVRLVVIHHRSGSWSQ